MKPVTTPVTMSQPCPVCHGSGQNPNHPGVVCNYCAGSGKLPGS